MELVLLAFVVGFLVAVPALGPATALIVRDMVRGRHRDGFAFAVGATTAEGLACLAAIWGIELAFDALPGLRTTLEWGATLIVMVVGLYFLTAGAPTMPDSDEVPAPDAAGIGGRTLAGFAITAFNPTLIATWATIIGLAISVTGFELATWQKWTIPVAITLGELTWFGLLILITRRFDAWLDARTIGWIIRIIGAALIVVGAWGLVQKFSGAW
jgi:threonine/homoserine/homoserine lactone efflux protein